MFNRMFRQIYGPSDLPVIFPADYNDDTEMYKYWRSEKRFISLAEDEANVARHVIRNAIGGADRGLSEALYMMEGSRRRTFRSGFSYTPFDARHLLCPGMI